MGSSNSTTRSQPLGPSISTTKCTQDHHCPTPDDVFTVRSFLLVLVPAELANLILNEANYWPKATLIFKPETPLVVEASSNEQRKAHVCCLVTSKLCDLLCGDKAEPYKIKSVCFKIVSHDQGWCDDNFPGIYNIILRCEQILIISSSIRTIRRILHLVRSSNCSRFHH